MNLSQLYVLHAKNVFQILCLSTRIRTACFHFRKPSALLRMRQGCFDFFQMGWKVRQIKEDYFLSVNTSLRSYLSESCIGGVQPSLNDRHCFCKRTIHIFASLLNFDVCEFKVCVRIQNLLRYCRQGKSFTKLSVQRKLYICNTIK